MEFCKSSESTSFFVAGSIFTSLICKRDIGDLRGALPKYFADNAIKGLIAGISIWKITPSNKLKLVFKNNSQKLSPKMC